MTERYGGQCGQLPDQLVRLGDKVPACAASIVDWSDDSCALQADMQGCTVEQGAVTTSQRMTLHQTAPDAWSGIADVDARAVQTGATCRSSYDVSATRQ